MSDKLVAGRVGDNALDLCDQLIRQLESIRRDVEADDRDWKQIAATLDLPAFATREEIVEACRALKRSKA
jgi:hypothetical protein